MRAQAGPDPDQNAAAAKAWSVPLSGSDSPRRGNPAMAVGRGQRDAGLPAAPCRSARCRIVSSASGVKVRLLFGDFSYFRLL